MYMHQHTIILTHLIICILIHHVSDLHTYVTVYIIDIKTNCYFNTRAAYGIHSKIPTYHMHIAANDNNPTRNDNTIQQP